MNNVFVYMISALASIIASPTICMAGKNFHFLFSRTFDPISRFEIKPGKFICDLAKKVES